VVAQDILRVSDILQLQAMKAIYCETVDACVAADGTAARRFGELFSEDVNVDYGVMRLSGRSAVVEFLVATIAGTNEYLWHSIGTPRVEVSGDTAQGLWTVMARMKRKGGTTFETLYGRYEDEFRRTPQGWRFSSVRFVQEK
jgi:hypothetical protein